MMEERLKQLMSDTNAVLEPWGLMVANPNIGRPVWHLYYYISETKSCFPVMRQRGPDEAKPGCMVDLVQGFHPETPATKILEWAKENGVLEN